MQAKCKSCIRKHRRLLRRRSTDSDACIVVTEAQDSKETARKCILALYGVHSSSSSSSVAKDVMDLCDEEALALDGQRSKSPEGHAQDMPLVDLTMSPSTPVLGHHGSGTSCSRPKQSYDEFFFGEVVRAWWEGNVELSDGSEGDDGFAYAVFEDSTTFTTGSHCGLGFAKNDHREQGPLVSTGLPRTRAVAHGWPR